MLQLHWLTANNICTGKPRSGCCSTNCPFLIQVSNDGQFYRGKNEAGNVEIQLGFPRAFEHEPLVLYYLYVCEGVGVVID